jgi:hypothetical protein
MYRSRKPLRFEWSNPHFLILIRFRDTDDLKQPVFPKSAPPLPPRPIKLLAGKNNRMTEKINQAYFIQNLTSI